MKEEKFLVSGGIPRVYGELVSGHAFKKAELAIVDFAKNRYTAVLNHKTPKDFSCDVAPSITFGSFCRYKDILYIPTRTEVLLVNATTFNVIEVITDKLFNDIHDVHVLHNMLYVAVTGMDAVFKIDLKTREREIINVLGKDPFHRFSENENLNNKASLKPHEAHPNFLFQIDDKIWVTRLKMKDAVCLSDINKRIVIDIGLPHDGFVKDDLIYFTTVNGYVVIVDKNTKDTVKRIRLTGAKNVDIPLGWCRGLYVDETHFYVGFTQLRTTRFTENIDWVKSILKNKKIPDKPTPTRIEKYTLDGDFVSEYRFPKNGIFNIFSIRKI